MKIRGRIFFEIPPHSAAAAARDARGLSIPEIFFSPDFFSSMVMTLNFKAFKIPAFIQN